MNKFCKILAVILAVLMLVTMATACKSNEEDPFEVMNPGTSSTGGNNNGGGDTDISTGGENDGTNGDDNSNGGSTNNGGGSTNNGGGSTNNGGGSSNNGGGSSNNGGGSSNNGGGNSNIGDGSGTATEIIGDGMKYDISNNPLVKESKAPNTGAKPSYDIDTAGFVKNGIKVTDLKGKRVTFLTSIRYGTFYYKGPKGEQLSEWDWFESLKGEYGLQVKYTADRFNTQMGKVLTYMNAGKELDVIPTHVYGFPCYLNLSQPLDPYINLQNVGNSPGIDEMTLNETKWGGTYRCIAPIGAVNVLWYNASMVEQFGLQDPHTLWEQDKWDWDAFRDFITKAPATNPEGKALTRISHCTSDSHYAFALTNGVAAIAIDTKSSKPALINNWDDPRVLEAWEFMSSVFKTTGQAANQGDLSNMYIDGTTLMADTQNLMNKWDSYEYAKTHKYNWVPYPKATTETGRNIAFNYGYSMMIPKKVKNTANIPYAVKFMELWANRFTEALFDYFATSEHLKWTYEQRKEYFEFVVSNTYFGLQMLEWAMLEGENRTAMSQWVKSQWDVQYNMATETKAVSNVIKIAISESLKYGN